MACPHPSSLLPGLSLRAVSARLLPAINCPSLADLPARRRASGWQNPQPSEKRDALRRGVLQSLGGSTAP